MLGERDGRGKQTINKTSKYIIVHERSYVIWEKKSQGWRIGKCEIRQSAKASLRKHCLDKAGNEVREGGTSISGQRVFQAVQRL